MLVSFLKFYVYVGNSPKIQYEFTFSYDLLRAVIRYCDTEKPCGSSLLQISYEIFTKGFRDFQIKIRIFTKVSVIS